MTPYTSKELSEDWEFKILRTYMGGFRNPERLQLALEQEKRGGWIFLEKLDDERVRLKRRAGTKVVQGDFADGYDPYRTMITFSSPGSNAQMMTLVGITVIGLILLVGTWFVVYR